MARYEFSSLAANTLKYRTVIQSCFRALSQCVIQTTLARPPSIFRVMVSLLYICLKLLHRVLEPLPFALGSDTAFTYASFTYVKNDHRQKYSQSNIQNSQRYFV